ncbi:MAG: WD40 repeat protein, partial [halophilic archaeon J07HX5]
MPRDNKTPSAQATNTREPKQIISRRRLLQATGAGLITTAGAGAGAAARSDNQQQPRWSTDLAGAACFPPLIANGTVYIGAEPSDYYCTVSAFDVDSGRQQGTLSTSRMRSLSAPAVVDGTVYIGDRDTVHVLNSTLSKLQRIERLGSYTRTPPVVTDGSVYIGCDDGIHALRLDPQRTEHIFTTQAAVRSLCVEDGTVYFGDEDWKVHAVDTSSGTQQWVREISGHPGSPVVDNGVVYVGATSTISGGTSRFYAIDADTGDELWRKEDHGARSPTIVDDTIVTSGDGVCGLNPESGATRWQFTDIQIGTGSPAVSDGTAYVPSFFTEQLYGLEVTTGAVSQTYEIDEDIATPVSVA